MIDELKPYPEYKDSGLSWLGKVPAECRANASNLLHITTPV
jgi:hypothetical protein